MGITASSSNQSSSGEDVTRSVSSASSHTSDSSSWISLESGPEGAEEIMLTYVRARTTNKVARTVTTLKMAFEVTTDGDNIGRHPMAMMSVDDPAMNDWHFRVWLAKGPTPEQDRVMITPLARMFLLVGIGHGQSRRHRPAIERVPVARDSVIKMGALSLQVLAAKTSQRLDIVDLTKKPKEADEGKPDAGAGAGSGSGAGTGAGGGEGKHDAVDVTRSYSDGAEPVLIPGVSAGAPASDVAVITAEGGADRAAGAADADAVEDATARGVSDREAKEQGPAPALLFVPPADHDQKNPTAEDAGSGAADEAKEGAGVADGRRHASFEPEAEHEGKGESQASAEEEEAFAKAAAELAAEGRTPPASPVPEVKVGVEEEDDADGRGHGATDAARSRSPATFEAPIVFNMGGGSGGGGRDGAAGASGLDGAAPPGAGAGAGAGAEAPVPMAAKVDHPSKPKPEEWPPEAPPSGSARAVPSDGDDGDKALPMSREEALGVITPCYVCFELLSDLEDNPLIRSPCRCRANVHRLCLRMWIDKRKAECSICRSRLPIDIACTPPYVVLQVVRHMRGLVWTTKREWVVSLAKPQRVVMGNGPHCDVEIPDPSLSNAHAELFFEPSEQQFFVKDLNSSSGTFVALQHDIEAPLGGEITFRAGRTVFTIRVKRRRRPLMPPADDDAAPGTATEASDASGAAPAAPAEAGADVGAGAGAEAGAEARTEPDRAVGGV